MSRGDDDYNDQDDNERRPGRRDDDDEGSSTVRKARDAVNVPSILMIVGGVLNLLFGGYLAVSGVFSLTVGKDQVMKDFDAQLEAQKKKDPKAAKDMENMPFSPEAIMKSVGSGIIAIGGLGVLTGILSIAGGIKMRSLSGRGFVLLSSVLSILPCITSPCCLAWPAALWAIIVLMNPDVKAAFR